MCEGRTLKNGNFAWTLCKHKHIHKRCLYVIVTHAKQSLWHERQHIFPKKISISSTMAFSHTHSLTHTHTRCIHAFSIVCYKCKAVPLAGTSTNLSKILSQCPLPWRSHTHTQDAYMPSAVFVPHANSPSSWNVNTPLQILSMFSTMAFSHTHTQDAHMPLAVIVTHTNIPLA
jgi:hypothetical protein